jgi:hypothetical protein
LRYDPRVFVKIRLLLIGLLIVALPFKAMAGVFMLGCSPAHHAHMMNAAAVAAGSQDAAGMGEHPAGSDGVSESHQNTASAGKCSSCTLCCMAAAPAPELQAHIAHRAADDGWVDVPDRYVGVIGDVPHGPPRLILG